MDMPMQNKSPIIVLGKGRSGTSMVSGILEILGVDMNAEHNPNFGNPKGDFECKVVRDINYHIYELARGHVFGQIGRAHV